MFEIFTNPYFIFFYVVLGLLQVWLTVYLSKRFGKSEELNAKYWSFARTDYKDWGYIWVGFLSLLFLYPIRFLICWLIVFTITAWAVISMIGHKDGTPIPMWRINLAYFLFRPLLRMLLFFIGVFWFEKKERKDVNYSKYLGSDWKPSFNGGSMLVCNH
jgi:hypothetical protein